MTKKESLQLFETKKVRTIWDDEQEKWYFAIVDVVAVLTEQNDYQTSRKYWNKLKQRLKEEGNETVTNCHQFKLQAREQLEAKIGKTIYLLKMPKTSRNCQRSNKRLQDYKFQLGIRD